MQTSPAGPSVPLATNTIPKHSIRKDATQDAFIECERRHTGGLSWILLNFVESNMDYEPWGWTRLPYSAHDTAWHMKLLMFLPITPENIANHTCKQEKINYSQSILCPNTYCILALIWTLLPFINHTREAFVKNWWIWTMNLEAGHVSHTRPTTRHDTWSCWCSGQTYLKTKMEINLFTKYTLSKTQIEK